MQREGDFTFRSIDLPRRCFNFFLDVKNRQKFCDVTFVMGKLRISAHRIVIAAAIPHFREKICTQEIVVNDVDAVIFESLINFAYGSELKINMENVKDLLLASRKLDMDEVMDACCEFLSERLCSENVLKFRKFADDLNYSQLIDITDPYIKENFVEIIKTDDFLNCTLDYVKELIAKDDINVDSEEKVLEAVLVWAKACPEERKSALSELLLQVRMPLIKPVYLTDILETEEIISTSPASQNLINEAKNYSSLTQSSSFSTKPRLKMKLAARYAAQNGGGDIYTLYAKIKYSVQRYDFEDDKWQTNISRSYFVNDCCTAELDRKMYYFLWGRALRYDPAKAEFEYLSNLTLPRIFAAAVAFDNRIYVCGGRVGIRKASDTVECFHPEKNEWTIVHNIPTARWGLRAVTYDDHIYVVGGKDESNVYDNVDRYSPVTDMWMPMTSMLSRRGCPGIAVLNGKIYVCGGFSSLDGKRCVGTAEIYDPNENKWKSISSMNTPRCEFTLIACRNKLYALGGYGHRRKRLYTCEIYDPQNDKWTFGPLVDFDHYISAAVVI